MLTWLLLQVLLVPYDLEHHIVPVDYADDGEDWEDESEDSEQGGAGVTFEPLWKKHVILHIGEP